MCFVVGRVEETLVMQTNIEADVTNRHSVKYFVRTDTTRKIGTTTRI